MLQLTGDLQNSGTIAGRSLVSINAENIKNLGGRISASDITLRAKTDLSHLGGLIDGANSVDLVAGRDMTIASTTKGSSNEQGTRTNIDRVAAIFVTQAKGKLSLEAGHDLTLNAAQLSNSGAEGNTTLIAGNDIKLGTVKESSSQAINWNATNYRKENLSHDVGSTIETSGNVTLNAGRDVSATAAQVSSEQGAITVTAKRDLNILSGESHAEVDEGHQYVTKGFLKKKNTVTRDELEQTETLSSSFSGNRVALQAGRDLQIVGSNIAATQDVTLSAKDNLTISAGTNSYNESHLKKETTSGLMGTGGIGFTYGQKIQSTKNEREGTQQSQSHSLIGSEKGNVTLTAGNELKVIGGDLTALAGDINASAKAITIRAGEDVDKGKQTQTFEQKGLTVALSAPVLTALETAYNMC